MPFQPSYRLGIEVVGRFVEQQNIRFAQEQTAQRNAALLTARKMVDDLVFGWAAQRFHRHLQAAVQVPSSDRIELFGDSRLALDQRVHSIVIHRLGKSFVDRLVLFNQVHRILGTLFDYFAHGLARLELRFLFHIADTVAVHQVGAPFKLVVYPSHNAQHRTLSRTIQTEHTDFGAVEIRQGYIFNDLLFVVVFTHLLH